MRYRPLLGVLAIGALSMPLVSCTNSPSLTSIVITPSTYTITLASNGNGGYYGGYWSYQAIGYYTHPDHTAMTEDITDKVTWISLAPIMVTMSDTGVATPTGLATGTSEIVATMPGFNGLVVSNASTFNVNLPTTTTTTDVTSLTITPANPSVAANTTVGFVVIGTTGTGSTENLTTESLWSSSNLNVATIGARTGLANALTAGASSIVATYTNPDGFQVTTYTTLTVQ